jgi:hypothetical protein
MRSALLTTRVTGLAAVAALATTVVLTAGLGTAVAAPGGGPGHWSQVTANGSNTIQDAGLARGGHSALNVIWAVKLPPATARILKVYISSQAGKGDVLALLTRHGKTAWYATQVK